MSTAILLTACAFAGLLAGVAITKVLPRLPVLLMAAATATLFAAIALRLGTDPALPAYCVLTAGLVVLSVIDVQTHRLPREVTYTTLAIGAPLLVVAALVEDEPQRLVGAGLGGVVATAVFWLGHVLTRGGLGPGDVRLAPLLGVYLGYVSVSTVAVGVVAGLLLATVFGIVRLAVRGRNEPYPFGPFLAAGTLATLLVVGTG